MQEDLLEILEPHLDRFREVLDRGGLSAFVQNPLLTPEPKWFSDQWTPDCPGVRRLILRLFDYAGLSHLDAEVGIFDASSTTWLPSSLASRTVQRGAAGLYFGTVNDVAYFGVEESELRAPESLLGVLAHEVTHAWRRHGALEAEDRAVEEELTDLTSIVLGFGILTTNTAYQYEAGADMHGAASVLKWQHSTRGYLSVELMSWLLAAYVLARGDDEARVRGFLGNTQRELFDRARVALLDVDLPKRLGLSESLSEHLERGGHVRFRPPSFGIAERTFHEQVVSLVEQLGEDGGVLRELREVELDPAILSYDRIAEWGRATADGGWWRCLYLIRDPVWETRALVLEAFDSKARAIWLAGHLPDRVCRNRKRLREALRPLFDPQRRDARFLAPTLPTGVALPKRNLMDEPELRPLLEDHVRGVWQADMKGDTSLLRRFEAKPRQRIRFEAFGAESPGEEKAAPSLFPLSWWDLVSDPHAANAERELIGLKWPKAGGDQRTEE